MAKKKEKKKPIFEKVGIVFRNPVRADIMRELSESPQRPQKIAENLGIGKEKKQFLNYHLNALKKGGLIKSHTEELSEEEIPKEKGTRINGVGEEGKIQVTYGVELTKNGKDVVNQYIDPLYEEESGDKEEKIKINKKEE
ncbi:MAG: helix-turn-helix transcriptional regulator [Candidatus Lokiarchaeota archaeon]|nr:helix-turn-helix transcriptional regulator [Candidatus Lokiarchaeota archaeon]